MDRTRADRKVGRRTRSVASAIAVALAIVVSGLAACSDDGDLPDLQGSGGAERVAAVQPSRATPPDPRRALIAEVQGDADGMYDFEAPAGADRAVAQTPAQRLSIVVSDGALRVQSAASESRWSLVLRWTGLGRATAIGSIEDPGAAPEVHDNRASWRRSDGSVEWYLNGPLGIEQGFELAERPRGDGPLALELSVAGLGPRLARDGRSVLLQDERGATVLHYSDLFAQDADGVDLETSLEVSGQAMQLHVDDAHARYPISVDPLVWERTARLQADTPATGEDFGASVAISGPRILVGADGEFNGASSAGAVYVFGRIPMIPNAWQLERKLAGNPVFAAHFGTSVALHGDTAVVAERGTGGQVYSTHLFYRNLGGVDNWGEAAQFSGSATAVAIDGDTVVVGRTVDGTAGFLAGAAHVLYRHQGGADQWGEVQQIFAADAEAGDEFGTSVDIHGDTIVVGAPYEATAGVDAGAAYVFYRNQGGADQWGQVRKIAGADTVANNEFGFTVGLDGDTIVVGAPRAHVPEGSAYVFYRDQGGDDQWGQVQQLADSTGSMWNFGWSVDISGDSVIVSEGGNSEAHVFERNEGGADQWGQVIRLPDLVHYAGEAFGESVAIDGRAAVVGAPHWENSFQVWGGCAEVFEALLQDGDPCVDGSQCSSDRCVDGVCCNWACGDGDPNDCWACSVAEGASVDGTCSSLDGASCDDGAFCNGTETCSGSVCGSSTGDPCPGLDGDDDCAESCDEAGDHCLADDPDGASCSDGLFCTGIDSCQQGVCTNAGNPCAGADGDGDCAESCDENGDSCLANDPNGSSCDDGLYCNGSDTCSAGSCSAHTGDPCAGPDGDGNCAESCSEGNDDCSAADPPLTGCDDGLFCTEPDVCDGQGACVGGGDPCTGPDGDGDCAESCSEVDDDCTAPDPQGSGCNDGLFCTQTDSCNAGGSCVGTGDPCPGADGDGDCAESCSEADDDCAAADTQGSGCDDGLFCTATDSCDGSGTCLGSGDTCPGPDGDGDCAEGCDEGTDSCSIPDEDGSTCDDADACTEADSCQAGSCESGTQVQCTPLDECHLASCNPQTGECEDSAVPDGTPCSVGTCQSGVCEPGGTGGGGQGGSAGSGGVSAGGGGAAAGNGGTGGEGPSTGGGDGSTTPEDDGGCGCRSVGRGSSGTPGWLALLGMASLYAGRARRRRLLRSRGAGATSATYCVT